MSEKEMLLLSNFVYMDISTDKMSIGESIDRFRNEAGSFDEKSVERIGIGGGMNAKEAAVLMKEIDDMPDNFKELYPSKVLNEEDVRGICYTKGGSDSGEGLVVFRGTGGTYEAWHDNVLGQCQIDTRIQKKAADFVENDCGMYSSLSICGHSKGGNLAMYATVLSNAAIDSCISFDGQGFSKDFINQYSDEISKASPKIKSISAYNDYVNILLYPIAGETIYTDNNGKGLYAHSSYQMFISNKYDENGKITSLRKRSMLSGALDELTDGMSGRLRSLPGSGNRDFTGLLAGMVAGILSSDKSSNYEKGKILESAFSVGEYLEGGISPIPSPIHSAIKLSALTNETLYEGMDEAGAELDSVIQVIERLGTELDVMREGMDPLNKIDCYINSRIGDINARLTGNARSIGVYSSTLNTIGRMYSKSENKVASKCGTIISIDD